MRVEAFLARSAAESPDKTALVCDGERYDYRWIDERAHRLAGGLAGLGVEPGDRVAVCLDNCVEAVVSIFGILKAGAVFVLVSPALRPGKLAFMLGDCGARVLIARGAKAASLEPELAALPYLETIVIVGDAASGASPPRSLAAWDDVTAAAGAPFARGTDLDLAALIYTSGSTGRPKGVMLTHRNMVAAATSVVSYLENRASDVIASVLPLSFSYGLYQVLTAFQVGATVVLEKSFAFPHAVLARLGEERATGLAVVPTIAALLLKLDLAAYPLGHLRYLTNAGGALPPEHALALRQRLPGAQLFLMYGLTECKRVSYLPPDQVERRPDSVGKAMPGVEAYVVDENGQRLRPGEVGELVVRGANVMRGYWNLPDETARCLKPGPLPGDRVLHTGDLFRTDAEGFLYFVGRRDDMIRSGGEKVSPTEIENVLYRLEGVELAAVIGVPHPLLGMVAKAVIVPREGAQLTANQVLRHCARHLEDIMIPKAIEFRSALPRNEAGKIDKLQLKDEN